MQHLQKTRGCGHPSRSAIPLTSPTFAPHGLHSRPPVIVRRACLFRLTSLRPCFLVSSLIVTVTKITSPQLVQIQHLQTVTPVTPLECAFTKTAGCHSLFLLSFHSSRKECFTTPLHLRGSAHFLETAGCRPTLAIPELIRLRQGLQATDWASSPKLTV